MKDIHIYCLHPSCKDVNMLRKEMHFDEREYDLNFIWDSENPDYLLISEWIYLDRTYMNSFVKYMKNRPIIINYPREFHTPDLNFSDYAIVWDRYLNDRDRIVRIPTMLYYEQTSIRNEYTQLTKEEVRELVIQKKFCNFVYSNGKAYPYRDQLFKSLTEYKKVDSYGHHLNNMGNKPDRMGSDWLVNSIKLKEKYRFTIACNNHWYTGGIDEKLWTTLVAHSIPIFWGDPSINEEFNEKAMINCHNYNTIDDVVEIVKKLDSDVDAITELLMQPWQTEEQLLRQSEKINEYYSFLCNIFNQHKDDARRAGEGTWRDNYISLIEGMPIVNRKKTSIIKGLAKGVAHRMESFKNA